MKVSKKHGLNPSITVCAWCGEDKNELILAGQLPGDAAMPHRCVVDYEPCKACSEKWSKGVALIEVRDTPTVKTQPPIQENYYPTGRYLIIHAEASKSLLGTMYPAGSRVLIDSPMYEQLLPKEVTLQ